MGEARTDTGTNNRDMTWPKGLGDQREGEPNFILFTAKERGIVSGTGTDEILGTVALPIPIGALASTYKANYENQALGLLGGLAFDAAEKMTTTMSKQGANFSDMRESLSEDVKKKTNQSGDTGDLGTAAIASLGGASALAKFKNNVMGTIKNPFQFVSYAGPEFRSFNMNWTLIPSSSDEAATIHKIVKFFKKCAVPSVSGFGGASYFKMPPFFGIEMRIFRFQGGQVAAEDGIVHRFAKSVLTSVDVDYNGVGALVPTFFHDGYPTATKLTLGFQETSLISREMVEEGY
tara:strand:+ start:3173 stop:4045 length:873 start_codon:yes stop_codon:yes gene_type:complete